MSSPGYSNPVVPQNVLGREVLGTMEDIQRLSKVNGTCIDFSPALNHPAPEIIGSMVPPLGEERYQKFFNLVLGLTSR